MIFIFILFIFILEAFLLLKQKNKLGLSLLFIFWLFLLYVILQELFFGPKNLKILSFDTLALLLVLFGLASFMFSKKTNLARNYPFVMFFSLYLCSFFNFFEPLPKTKAFYVSENESFLFYTLTFFTTILSIIGLATLFKNKKKTIFSCFIALLLLEVFSSFKFTT